jgi:hypothetical protein
VARFEAYTNPFALLDEGIADVWENVLPLRQKVDRLLSKVKVALIQQLANSMKAKQADGVVKPVHENSNPRVLGYMCLFQKDALQ